MKTNQKRSWLGGVSILARISHWFCVASMIFFFLPVLRAQNPTLPLNGTDAAAASSAPTSETVPHIQDDWVSQWLRTVDKARAEQPHYLAPLITTHVLLVQQFRFDS